MHTADANWVCSYNLGMTWSIPTVYWARHFTGSYYIACKKIY